MSPPTPNSTFTSCRYRFCDLIFPGVCHDVFIVSTLILSFIRPYHRNPHNGEICRPSCGSRSGSSLRWIRGRKMVATSTAAASRSASLTTPSSVENGASFFEKKTFRRLTITQKCLEAFKRLGLRALFIKHLWFRIQLAEYHCLKCRRAEIHREECANAQTVQRAIEKLFHRLVLQKTIAGVSLTEQGKATLELSIHSPSDCIHHFQHCQFGSVAAKPSWDDPGHGFVGGLLKAPQMGPVMRLCGFKPIYIGSLKQLPTVSHITELIIRRQTRRRLAPESLRRILRALPSLHTLAIETWREWTTWQQQIVDIGKICTLPC